MSSTKMDPWQLLEAIKNRTEYFQNKHANSERELFDSFTYEMTRPRWSWLKFKFEIPERPTDGEIQRYARLSSRTYEFSINNSILKARMAENDTLRQLAEIAIRTNEKVTISHEHSFIEKYIKN